MGSVRTESVTAEERAKKALNIFYSKPVKTTVVMTNPQAICSRKELKDLVFISRSQSKMELVFN